MTENHTIGTYAWWRESAWALLEPMLPLMKDGASELAIEGPPSDHDANADRLEAFARPCLLAAFWLQAEDGLSDAPRKQQIAGWFRSALVLGTDQESEHYWGPNASYHQNGVEMGLLVIALKAAEGWLWEPLSEPHKQQVARWMASNRGTGHHWNNHLFFGVLALEFLREVGISRPSDEAAMEVWFHEMELMYRGDGWFMDGMNQSYDHYNAYAFHFYGPVWAMLYGKRQPERAARWMRWSAEFLQSYQHFFAASGEHPAFGRSIAYRFNAAAPFAAAAVAGASEFPHGRARRLLSRNLDFFLQQPIAQQQGLLSLGWHDAFPEMAEKYSCAGSPYWAAKSFICLMLPPEHAFWNAPEEPLPAEQGDFVHVVQPAGLVVRSIAGEVEILNAGSEITPVNKEKFGPWKWGKLAYRTGVGFTIGLCNEQYSRDMGLTATGGLQMRTYGRHFTTPIAMEAGHMAAVYSLGDKYEQINSVVETYLWWKGGWLLQLHHYDNYQSLQMTLGGYALPSRSADAFHVQSSDRCIAAFAKGQGTALQALSGRAQLDWEQRTDASTQRSHVQAPWHVTPLLQREAHAGPDWLAALCWAGSDANGAAPWQVISTPAGEWQLQHPALGKWIINHALLPALG